MHRSVRLTLILSSALQILAAQDIMDPALVRTRMAAGLDFTVYRRDNGTVTAWGPANDARTQVPAGLANVVDIAAAGKVALALTGDGDVTIWGNGIIIPPAIPKVIAISANGDADVARYGLVTADMTGYLLWPSDAVRTSTTLPAPAGATLTAIHNTLDTLYALYDNGDLYGWHVDQSHWSLIKSSVRQAYMVPHPVFLLLDGTVEVISPLPGTSNAVPFPSEAAGAVQVSAGDPISAARFTDGRVYVWNDRAPYWRSALPIGLTDVVDIVGSPYAVAARRSDGSIVEWSGPDHPTVPPPNHLLDLAAPAMPVITNSLTLTPTWQTAVHALITATGTPTSYAATGLPPEWTVNTGSGLISGPATTEGAWTVRIHASNRLGTASADLRITVTKPPDPPPAPITPVITSATSVLGYVGYAFSYQIQAAHTPTSYAATGLPAGWTINPATGLITGTPATASSVTLSISATNDAGTDSEIITVLVTNDTPPVGTPTLGSGDATSGRCGAGALPGIVILSLLGLVVAVRGRSRPGR